VEGRDPPQVVVWRIGADILKEGADLPGPFIQVRAENQRFLVSTSLSFSSALGR
jgi:hypothetical protein